MTIMSIGFQLAIEQLHRIEPQVKAEPKLKLKLNGASGCMLSVMAPGTKYTISDIQALVAKKTGKHHGRSFFRSCIPRLVQNNLIKVVGHNIVYVNRRPREEFIYERVACTGV